MTKIADCGCQTNGLVSITIGKQEYYLCAECAKAHRWAMGMYKKYSEAANAKA